MTGLALGLSLRRARERAYLSQQDAAERIGVSVRTYRTWEQSDHPDPWPRHKAAIARFLRESEEAA